MDLIVYNGTLCHPQTSGLVPTLLDERPWLYQHIHTRSHRALHLDDHLNILQTALQGAYGIQWPLSSSKLQQEIGELLAANRFPRQGNRMILRIYPEGLDPSREGGEPVDYLLACGGPLYYPRYTLWHTRPMLCLMPCEYLLMGYPTSMARQAALYSHTVARREGAGAAVIENGDGVLTNVEDEPLFVGYQGKVLTSPLKEGASDTVMRRLILKACRAGRIPLEETPLHRDLLLACEEAFTGSVEGLVSFAGYGPARYFSLMASRLVSALERLAEEDSL